jgi:NB-ARC domain
MIASLTMDIAEVLKIADDLMFDSTSKYLDNLQRSIVEGVWEGKTYKDIADSTDRSEGHIRDSASTLWKDISEAVGENVRRSNFKSVVERNHFSIVSSHNRKDTIQVANINFCSDRATIDRTVGTNLNLDRDKNRFKRDVGNDIPHLFPFYGRDFELKQLKQWIVQDECRLINVFGVSGIGKTALMSQLSTQIEDEFECVIWQSLRSKRSLVDLIDRDILPSLPIEIIADAHHDLETRISFLIEQLSKHRCLIVLDDIHQIFSGGDLAGTYDDDYLEYRELFRRISESNHQSCMVVMGWEQPREFAMFSRSIPTLALDGLSPAAQQQILKDREIVNADTWVESSLVPRGYANAYYGGNPLWLNVVATTIKDLFGGRIDDFCQDNRLLLTNDLKLILQSQYDRLSEIERQVIHIIAAEDRAISLLALITASKISPANLLEALQSLGRRRLVEKEETETGVLFSIQPILKEFVSVRSSQLN